jgi:Cu/Ag efflux pump CusA
LQDILDAVNHTNLIDSPGLLSRNHQLFLGLITAQVQTPEEIGDIVIKDVNDVPVRIAISARSAFHGAELHRGYRERQAARSCSASTASRIATRWRWPMKSTRRSKSLRSDLPAGVELKRFLRPVEYRSRIDWQRAGRDHHRLFLTGFIIWLFLRDLGTAMMAGVVVPVTICITFVVMKIWGKAST